MSRTTPPAPVAAPLRVLLVEPAGASEARGNAVTVARWARGLRCRGLDVVTTSCAGVASWPGRAALVHAHHAGHCGPGALALARRLGVPLVLSLGGTDLNGGPDGDPEPRAVEPLLAAAAVVGPNRSDGERLAGALDREVPFHAVRRGIEPASPLPPRAPDGTVRLLLPGGIRPVKRQVLAAVIVDALAAGGLPVSLTLAGPVLDAAYAAELDAALAGSAAARRIAPVPHDRIRELWADHDALLNVSESEGASNAILEAWSLGRYVAAIDVPGNRELLEPAPADAAALFPKGPKGPDLLRVRLQEFAADSLARREERAGAARSYVAGHHHVDDEIRELLAAYRTALGR